MHARVPNISVCRYDKFFRANVLASRRRTSFTTVYLSAAHILLKDYTGRRLDALLKLHPRNMTNFWPYLRLRRAEVSRRRHVFEQSFLGQYTRSMGCDPLSVRLWAGPDDEKQVDVALRFVTK